MRTFDADMGCVGFLVVCGLVLLANLLLLAAAVWVVVAVLRATGALA